MKVADLFIDVSVIGDGKAQKTLINIDRGLGSVAESGLAAKAGILASLYGLQQLTSHAAEAGMNLRQFEDAGYGSAEMLQKWQRAALDFGVRGDEVAGTAKSIRNAITDMQMGKGEPFGFSKFVSDVGVDMSKLDDTFYLMSKMQQFMKQGDPAFQKKFLAGLGIGDTMAAMLRRENRDVSTLAGGFSSREKENLAKIKAEWDKLWYDVDIKFGRMIQKDGGKLIGDIHKLVNAIMELGQSLVVLSEKFGVFQTLAVSLKGITDAVKILSGGSPNFGNLNNEPKPLLPWGNSEDQLLPPHAIDNWLLKHGGISGAIQDFIHGSPLGTPSPENQKWWEQNHPKETGKPSAAINLNQYFYGDQTPAEVAEASQRGIESAVRNSPAATRLS